MIDRIRSNEMQFKNACGPFEIDEDTLEVSKCFFPCGPHYPGMYGLMAYHNGKNAGSFEREEGFVGGGILLFPNTLKLGLRDLSFVDTYHVTYAWGRSFGGKFPYRERVYDVSSITLDINNMSIDRMLEIAKDIAHKRWDTDVVCKVCPSNRIFLVKRKSNESV